MMQQRLFLNVVLHIQQLWQETEVEGLHLRRRGGEGRGGEGEGRGGGGEGEGGQKRE